ncbi:MAG: hypothetical protein HPY50_11405 [Firmicutes bacterium]|nr:hypothetical protein [Bacillota bacterium]
MKGILKKRSWLVAVVVLIFAFGTVSVIQAASYMNIRATPGVKILYNGKELTGTTQPYIINDSTYVPLRMLMDNFGDKFIYWDSVGYRVLITDKTSASAEQLAQKDAEIASLKSQINTLNAKVKQLEEDEDDISVGDIKSTLSSYLKDAGDDYFNDDGIKTSSISVSGTASSLNYVIKLDFTNADDYEDLSEASASDIEDLLDDVNSKIEDKIDGTDFEGADITGKLYDNDRPSLYVKYDGDDYTYSWDDVDETTVSELEDSLSEYVVDLMDTYFGDDGISSNVSLSGSTSALAYTIKLDFTGSDHSSLKALSANEIRNFLNAVKSKINHDIDGTRYEGAKITGKLSDNDRSNYNVKYNGSTYTFSW